MRIRPLLPFALLLNGCAATLNHQPGVLRLESQPSGATVMVNGAERGSTPYEYTYDKADGSAVRVAVVSPGYQQAEIVLQPEMHRGVLFVDAMLFHIPYLFDRNSAHLYRFTSASQVIDLYKEPSKSQVPVLLAVSGFESAVMPNASLGRIGSKQFRNDQRSPFKDLSWPDQLASEVVGGLKAAGYDAVMARRSTTRGTETIERAKSHLRGRLLSVDARLTGSEASCSGDLETTVAWELLSGVRADSVLRTWEVRTTYHALNERASVLMGQAVRHAAHLLGEDPTLPEQLAEARNQGLLVSRGESLSLKRPTPVAFASRKEMFSALITAVVTVESTKGHGSGFIITNDGYLLTNHHVVGDESHVKVRLQQGFTLDAQVVKLNKDADLALLKVTASELPALRIGSDSGLMVGEEVFAIGTPVDASLGQSVSRGILSGRRDIDGRSLLQTDVSMNPGNSGGPLVDEQGDVVGISTLKISGKGLEGLGFAIPISTAFEQLNLILQP